MSTDQLPERDPTKTNAQQGLYGKFRIERTDGISAPGCKHHGCDYFVLDVTNDKHAVAALAAYADAAGATHPQLAADMRSRWNLPAQPAGDAAMPCGHHRSLMLKSAETGADLYCELCDAQSGRRDAEQREAELQADLVEERNRIAGMRVEWAAEVAALQAEGAKSERRAIEFGDALHRHILAMRASFVAWHRAGPAEGMAWVINTLAGPGHLPSESDIALGAQALFDKEVAEHEAFRAAHPGPGAHAPRDTAAMLAEHKMLVTEVGAAGWACNSARLRAAELVVEASARKLLGEA